MKKRGVWEENQRRTTTTESESLLRGTKREISERDSLQQKKN
jgi:hypothetical protein